MTIQMDNICRVYCINLRRRTDRLTQFLDVFPKEWFDKLRLLGATDGQSHTLTQHDRHHLRHANWNIDVGRGQWGCSFSHEAVWRTIAKNRHSLTLVLEDDAVFTGFDLALNQIVRSFLETKARVCLLGPSNHPENTPAQPHDFTDMVAPALCRVKSNLGTMSYMLTCAAAEDLLAILEEKGHYRAIDQVLNDYMKQHNAWICGSPPQFKLNPVLGTDIPPVMNWKPTMVL
jgi:GR25 family glycosyltransferase involved in LPS biosynthesis